MTHSSQLDLLRQRLPDLLAAIPGSDPSGESIRETKLFGELREARHEDDASLPTGIWDRKLKVADWATTERIASDLLARRSKDLLIAAWLGEAWIQQYALEGVYGALEMLAALCERYHEQLHPRAEGTDKSWLDSPLSWLVGRYSELLRTQTPLFGGLLRGFETFTHDQWITLQQQAADKSDERRAQASAKAAQVLKRQLRDALGNVPASEWLARIELLNQCVVALDQLDRWSDGHLDAKAPSFGPLAKAMDLHREALQEILAMHPNPTPTEPEVEVTESTTQQAAVATAPPSAIKPMGVPDSRQEAYRQLRVIADYLLRAEPQSPAPYLIKRAIDWGQKPLPEMLEEFINADADMRKIWKVLGVLP